MEARYRLLTTLSPRISIRLRRTLVSDPFVGQISTNQPFVRRGVQEATVPARTNRNAKWQFLPQSEIPQHIEYVLSGTFDGPRTLCNAKATPQRRAQRTHDNAPVGQWRSGLMGQQRCAITCRDQALDCVVVVELNARRRVVTAGREPLRSQTRETRGCVVKNERLSREPRRRDASRTSPMCRHEGHDGVATPGLYRESSHRRLRQSDQPNIQRSIGQSGQRFMRSEYRNLNVDSGMVLAQHLERLRQQVRDRAGRRTEPHASGEPFHLAVNIVQRLLGIGQQSTRALYKHLAYRRRPNMSALA